MSVLKVGEADDELAAALADQNKLGQRQENRRRVIWVDRVFPFKLGASPSYSAVRADNGGNT
jgi:predicted pyridoxine 5'-phosphate oxidase superfamily flavin-nucleotide-binding protein